MKLKVSLAQINPVSGDIMGNREKILLGIAQAKEEGCDLVVFPEMCLTGYCLDEKLLNNIKFIKENKRALMEEIVPASMGIAVIVGFLDFNAECFQPGSAMIRYNAAAIAQNGKLLQIVHKRLLPAYRYFDDTRYFTAGREVEPVAIQVTDGTVLIGVLICEDLWEEDYDFKPCTIYGEKKVDHLFSINASPFVGSRVGDRDGKRFQRAALIQDQVNRCGAAITYLNTVGVGDNGKNIIPFDGMSMAYGSDRQLVAILKQFDEDQQIVSFENGNAQSVIEPAFDRDEEIFRALVMGVRDYYNKMGIFTKVLETVSGGIDSALGAAIAYEAMGPEFLSLYNLPSKFNSRQGQDLSRQLAQNFGLEYHVIPIQEVVDQVVKGFEKHLHSIQSSTTVENLQSRIRGLIMMAESNDQRALLLSNGNQTEIALGYATLYGDMAGGLSVIGDITKPDVYRLGRYVNRKWDCAMIPEGIFEAAPSAELDHNQIDPFDYEVVGPVVSDFVEKGLGPRDLINAFKKRQLDVIGSDLAGHDVYQQYNAKEFERFITDIFSRLNRSVYKRFQGAPIIAVSRRAFGFDLRETIINGWSNE